MRRSPLLPIFLIVLVDVLGFTIVIPLLTLYAKHFGASPIVATSIVSVYAVCSLISTPIIGRLSDRHGRRPLLMLSQAGTCAGFLVLAGASSLWMVFVGRILDGLTAGNLSIAQAYISDHTEPKDRAKSFGVIGVAFGIGFLFGPALGGVLGKVYMWLPFVLAACLSAVSMTCTYFLLPRDLPPQVDAPVTPGPSDTDVAAPPPPPAGRRPSAFDVNAYLEYFRRPGLGGLYAQFFLFAFAFAVFTSGFALFAQARYGWSEYETGLLFSFSGVLGIIMQGGLIGRLVKRFGEAPLVVSGFIAAAIGYVVLGFATVVGIIIVAAFFSAYGNGVLRPVITSRISQAVGRTEQGAALGVSGALQSIALVLAPEAGGALLQGNQLMGWCFLAAFVALLGLGAALISRRPPKVTPATPRA